MNEMIDTNPVNYFVIIVSKGVNNWIQWQVMVTQDTIREFKWSECFWVAREAIFTGVT